MRHATHNGFQCRFDTSFISYDRQPDGSIISEVLDGISKQTYKIRSKYLFGCDGARSQVLRQLNIPLAKKPGQGLAINVLVKVDLEEVMQHRLGNLHWVMRPDEDQPAFSWATVVRMVKPWNEWMFILFPRPGAGVEFNPSRDEYLECVKKIVGDDSLKVEILNISKWFVNEIVAEHYSEGNM